MLRFDWIVLLCIGVFLLLFGIFSVTNIQIEWGKPIMGYAALIAGVICVIRAFAGFAYAPPK